MPANIQDVLKINIVFVGVNVLTSPKEFEAFSREVGTEVTEERVEIGNESTPVVSVVRRNLSLKRDRIILGCLQERTIIEREFPTEDSLSRLVEVAGKALQISSEKGTPRAFGYNLELVYDQDVGVTAFHYIGERLFREGAYFPEGWELAGGAGRLLFNSDEGRWTIQIEPRFSDENTSRVFLNLNFHKEEGRLPNKEEMLSTFRQVWEQSHNFAHRLDEGTSL